MGTHAKRQSPSRIPAQGVTNCGCRRGAQTAPSKPLKAWRYRWWARMRNGRAPARFQPKGWPMWLQTRCPNSTFETAKSMEVPVVGTHAKRQSPSRVPAQGVGNVAADEVPKHAFETAKSMEVPVVGTHAKRQSPISSPRGGQCGCRRGAQTRLRNR